VVSSCFWQTLLIGPAVASAPLAFLTNSIKPTARLLIGWSARTETSLTREQYRPMSHVLQGTSVDAAPRAGERCDYVREE
jgi:hypothetical protein